MALDDLIREATRSFSAQLNEALEALASNLARAAADDRAQAVEAQKAESERVLAGQKADAERALAEREEQVRAEVEEAALARIETLRAEAQRAAHDRTDAAERAAAALSAELATVKAMVADEVERAVTAERAGAERMFAEHKAGAERTLAEREEQVRAEVEEAALGRIEAMRAEAQKAADARVDAAHVEARQAAEAEIARARADAQESIDQARSRAAADGEAATTRAVGDAVAGERQGHLACVERLLAAVRAIDEGRSLTDVLGALATGAAAEAPRVAVLLLQGTRVRSWRAIGFTPDPSGVDLEIADAGVIGRAIRTGAVAFAEPSAPGQTFPAGPGFVTLPPDRSGFAVPLVVGRTTVAVLYADDVSDAAQMKPAPWPEALELLARHASVCLENLTAVRTAQAFGLNPRTAAPPAAAGTDAAAGSLAEDEDGARRYARLLVSEIKLYNEAAVHIGRQKRDLLERLRPEIDRARRLYEARVPPAVRERRDFFSDELLQTLADGDQSVLGRRTDALA